MAVIELNELPQCLTDSVQLNMGTQNTMSFTYATALFGTAPCAVDDIVLLRKWNPDTDGEDIIFKGIVRKLEHSLGNETVKVVVVGAEFALESQPWTPVVDTYNDHQACGTRAINKTIGQAIASEFGLISDIPLKDPRAWFTDIEVPASVEDLLCAGVSTIQKSFMTFISELIALYPHIRTVIEYDPTVTTLFPIGKLILVDATIGRDTHALQVGGVSPDVVDANITEDASECAANILAYGRGNFIETLETLTPDWNTADESIANNMEFEIEAGQEVRSYLTYMVDEEELSSVPVITADAGAITLYYGVDFFINFELNSIEWIKSDYYVNNSTGALGSTVSGAPPGATPPWRRTFAYDNGHLTKTVVVSFTTMARDCYRRYRTTNPIANLRLMKVKIPNPASPGSGIDSATEQQPCVFGFIPPPARAVMSGNAVTWGTHIAKKYTPANDFIVRATTDVLGQPAIESVGPDGSNGSMEAYADAYTFPTETPGFQEGGHCVYFKDRQLALVVGQFTPDDVTPPYPWITWDVKLLYTAWNNVVQTRTGLAGTSLYIRVVCNSALRYESRQGDTVLDNTARLTDVADALEAYYGAVNWSGSIVVHVERDATTKLPIVPYKVGDTVTFTGDIDAHFTPFVGLVAGVDLSKVQTDNAIVTLQISRREPKRNPFVQRPAGFVDAEALSIHPSEIFGLQRL